VAIRSAGGAELITEADGRPIFSSLLGLYESPPGSGARLPERFSEATHAQVNDAESSPLSHFDNAPAQTVAQALPIWHGARLTRLLFRSVSMSIQSILWNLL
jgi:hypothetical protein